MDALRLPFSPRYITFTLCLILAGFVAALMITGFVVSPAWIVLLVLLVALCVLGAVSYTHLTLPTNSRV